MTRGRCTTTRRPTDPQVPPPNSDQTFASQIPVHRLVCRVCPPLPLPFGNALEYRPDGQYTHGLEASTHAPQTMGKTNRVNWNQSKTATQVRLVQFYLSQSVPLSKFFGFFFFHLSKWFCQTIGRRPVLIFFGSSESVSGLLGFKLWSALGGWTALFPGSMVRPYTLVVVRQFGGGCCFVAF